MPNEEFKHVYESAMITTEVAKLAEEANLIGKAVQIMLDNWQDERDQNGELRFMQVFEKALKCRTRKQIQSTLLRKPLDATSVTYDELIEQGFSDEVIKSLNE